MSDIKILCKIFYIYNNVKIMFTYCNCLEKLDKIIDNFNNNNFLFILDNDNSNTIVNCQHFNNIFYVSDNIDIKNKRKKENINSIICNNSIFTKDFKSKVNKIHEKNFIEEIQNILYKNNINFKVDNWYYSHNEKSLLWFDRHFLDLRDSYMLLNDIEKILKEDIIINFLKESWARANLPSKDYINNYICQMIDKKEPFSIIRTRSEDKILTYHILNKKLNKDYFNLSQDDYEKMFYNCGVYPFKDDKIIDSYISKYCEAYKNCNIITYHAAHDIDVFKLIYYEYCKNNEISKYQYISFPFQYPDSWGWKLEGKKVLVISSFSDSVRYQYDKLGAKTLNLPNFELITYSAPQSICGNELDKSWEISLNKMEKEINDINFDIALVACGGYGTPITDYIKKIGKQGIYIGGLLQVIFFIKGMRYKKWYNQNWKDPYPHEIPKNHEKVEGGCYWN